MIFTISQEALLDAINIIQRGLPTRTPLPILNGIKLEVKEDHLVFTSSNSDLGIQMIVQDESLEVLATGQTVIPGRYLIDITRKLDGPVEMSLIENKVLLIRSDRVEYKLHTMNVEDYPEVNFLENNTPIKFSAALFKEIIKETNYATSELEKRPILTGVNFKYEDKNSTAWLQTHIV